MSEPRHVHMPARDEQALARHKVEDLVDETSPETVKQQGFGIISKCLG
jgi:hypothetical protein